MEHYVFTNIKREEMLDFFEKTLFRISMEYENT